MRYSLGVSHLIPVKDIMCGVGGTSSSILSRFIVLAFLAQCCGDSRLIGKSGIYNAFFIYIYGGYHCHLVYSISDFRLMLPIDCILYLFPWCSSQVWDQWCNRKFIRHASWCMVIYTNRLCVGINWKGLLVQRFDGRSSYFCNVVDRKEGILYRHFVSYFRQLSSFPFSYILFARLGVISSLRALEFEEHIILRMIFIIRHF